MICCIKKLRGVNMKKDPTTMGWNEVCDAKRANKTALVLFGTLLFISLFVMNSCPIDSTTRTGPTGLRAHIENKSIAQQDVRGAQIALNKAETPEEQKEAETQLRLKQEYLKDVKQHNIPVCIFGGMVIISGILFGGKLVNAAALKRRDEALRVSR